MKIIRFSLLHGSVKQLNSAEPGSWFGLELDVFLFLLLFNLVDDVFKHPLVVTLVLLDK